MATQKHYQISSKIEAVLSAILRSLARKKSPTGFHIDRGDLRDFNELITIQLIECLSENTVRTEGVRVEENDSLNVHMFPGHPTREVTESQNIRASGDVNLSLNPQVVRIVRASGRGQVGIDIHSERNSREEPEPTPAHARMRHCRGALIDCHRVYLTFLDSSCSIRVYPVDQVVKGAAVGGGVGAAGGAVGGTAGGIAAGALIGSVVPVAGTIVGGVIGGIVGGIGGLVAGGAAGSGAGAGAGAARSNSRQKTISAVEVFEKLKDFSLEGNRCHGVVDVNTVCPYEEFNLVNN